MTDRGERSRFFPLLLINKTPAKRAERNLMTANLTMQANKKLTLTDMFDIYRYELDADALQIHVPRYYGTQDLSQTEGRICFALGSTGDYAVLQKTQVSAEQITYDYPLGGALTAQSGIYQLWLEFYIFDPDTNQPSFCLRSEMAQITVCAHRSADQLLSETQITYLEELTGRIRTLADQVSREVAEAVAMAEQLQSTVSDRLSRCFVQKTEPLSLSHTDLYSTNTQNLLIGPTNTATQKFNLTFGFENENRAWGGLVGGFQNVSTGSQQVVLGEGNTAPGSKNMAVFGQFCDSAYTDAQGQLLQDGYADTRPLLTVGNGKNSQERSNAFTVYADGEAVLAPDGVRLPIGQTLNGHTAQLGSLTTRLNNQEAQMLDHTRQLGSHTAQLSTQLSRLDSCASGLNSLASQLRAQETRLTELESSSGDTAATEVPYRFYNALAVDVDSYLRDPELKWYDGSWQINGAQLTQPEVADGFRRFLTAWEQDSTVMLHLDAGGTIVSSFVKRLETLPCPESTWGYLIYFPAIRITVCVCANDLQNGVLTPSTPETASDLRVLLARGNGFVTEDLYGITSFEETLYLSSDDQTAVFDLTQAKQKAAAAGKRIFGISLCYTVAYDRIRGTSPIYPVAAFTGGVATKTDGLTVTDTESGLTATVTPALFGWTEWQDRASGGQLKCRLELI